jgi:hypothetical protein
VRLLVRRLCDAALGHHVVLRDYGICAVMAMETTANASKTNRLHKVSARHLWFASEVGGPDGLYLRWPADLGTACAQTLWPITPCLATSGWQSDRRVSRLTLLSKRCGRRKRRHVLSRRSRRLDHHLPEEFPAVG